MSRETLAALAGSTANTYQVELQYETLQRYAWLSYLTAPAQTAIRIFITTLLLQMICLFFGIEARFSPLLRVAAFGFVALLLGSIIQIVWVSQFPTAIEQASLGIVPDSIAALMERIAGFPTLLRLTLNRISATSLLWILLLVYGLRQTIHMRPATAVAVASATWTLVSVLHIAVATFAEQLAA